MNAIEVRDLHISYKTIKAKSIKKTLFSLKKSTTDRYEAVRGVSFDVKKGEIVGLIGKNGSGKSTLLRSIAGIFAPDSGTIDVKGNKVSLLAIGVGFQNELSGRENIYLSGLLMGFTKEQIDEKYDEIVEFSEIGKFINSPVKTYSSGMHSKLAFAITAILETDIMLVDETLSVGDRRFKKKSYAKMKELISHKDRTVIIVSHSSNTIEGLCDRVIWLDEGRIVEEGETTGILERYNEQMDYQEELEAKGDRNYWYKKMKVKDNQILFYPIYARSCDDIRYLCKYMLKNNPDWNIFWVINKEGERIDLEGEEAIHFVVKGTPRYYRALYSSKVIVDDGMNVCKDDMRKDPKQLIYKLFKGSLGIKTMGKKTVPLKKREKRAELGRKHSLLVDYCISNSRFESKVYKRTFWKENKIIVSGHPRNDLLFADEDERKKAEQRVREYYHIEHQNHIALYAPTYRESRMIKEERELMDIPGMKEALKNKFGGEWTVLVRVHPADMGKWEELEQNSEAINVSDYPEITELLIASDVGVTDYSSWIYDYILLNKPGFLYTPDRVRYEKVRGLYFPLEETPFGVAENNVQLCDIIANFDEEGYAQKIKEFLERQGCREKGNACEKFVEKLNEHVAE